MTSEVTTVLAHPWAYYQKRVLQPMRPYIPGEDLTGISVWDGDTPEQGGMIAQNPDDPEDRWYVAKDFFEKNYDKVRELFPTPGV